MFIKNILLNYTISKSKKNFNRNAGIFLSTHSVLGETHSLQSVEKIQTSKYFLEYFGFLRVKQSVPRKKTSALAVVKSEPFERKTQF